MENLRTQGKEFKDYGLSLSETRDALEIKVYNVFDISTKVKLNFQNVLLFTAWAVAIFFMHFWKSILTGLFLISSFLQRTNGIFCLVMYFL